MVYANYLFRHSTTQPTRSDDDGQTHSHSYWQQHFAYQPFYSLIVSLSLSFSLPIKKLIKSFLSLSWWNEFHSHSKTKIKLWHTFFGRWASAFSGQRLWLPRALTRFSEIHFQISIFIYFNSFASNCFTRFTILFGNFRFRMGEYRYLFGDHGEILVGHHILRHQFTINGNLPDVFTANGTFSRNNWIEHHWHSWTVYRIFGKQRPI